MNADLKNSNNLVASAAHSVDGTRREILKIASVAVPAAAVTGAAGLQAQTAPPPAPPATPAPAPLRLTPFLEPMPITPVLRPRSVAADPAFAAAAGGAPTVTPNRAINPATGKPFEGRGDAHQLRDLNPPQDFYVQRYGAVPPMSIHPMLPRQVNFWGSNLGGADLRTDAPMTPMPTIVTRYNRPVLVRRFNHLPEGVPSGGFGFNSVSTHLHNFHSAPDSDGGPCDPTLGALAEDPRTQGRFFFTGQYYDYYYNMKRSGFNSTHVPDGDIRETLGTLWYHDHREAHTAENVYKGLAGMHIVFNEYDNGDETNPNGFRLPSYPNYDIPVLFTDLKIDPATGQASFNKLDNDGQLGNVYAVNGKVQPFFNVLRRRYRFRLLDASPTRFYELFLTNPDNPSQRIPYWRIANDGNLYERPLQVTSVKLGNAERADVIIDFAKLTAPGGPAAGARRLWLENRTIHLNPRKPEDELDVAGKPENVLIEFRINQTVVVADRSADPATITSFAPITLPPLETPAITRVFDWGRGNGAWVVNGKPIDCASVRFTMQRGRLERWIYKGHGGWAHPIHNHFVEGRIIRRNGVLIRPGDQEYVRKDVVSLYQGDEVEYWVRATDYEGVYPMHCHNLLHEDAGMMLLFRVAAVGDNNPAP